MEKKCQTCGRSSHNFREEEILSCVPPKDVLDFGEYEIDQQYREALYEEYPGYTVEEIIGSYLGYNPYFPDQDSWLAEQEEVSDEDDE